MARTSLDIILILTQDLDSSTVGESTIADFELHVLPLKDLFLASSSVGVFVAVFRHYNFGNQQDVRGVYNTILRST